MKRLLLWLIGVALGVAVLLANLSDEGLGLLLGLHRRDVPDEAGFALDKFVLGRGIDRCVFLLHGSFLRFLRFGKIANIFAR